MISIWEPRVSQKVCQRKDLSHVEKLHGDVFSLGDSAERIAF